ncbi:ABC transporter permease [Mesorhizobium sp. M2A.F.Ca.ET.042.01.1.1]|uniref:ABC transporter permease n=1 Tax=Mesorhizobium sp. M2A.F.Ca.ET.042.01.1.1 TaxID=2496745 RepID=UPI000FCBF964|nr:ABC transporter permease [Mesorhizobium sp. M2A.F.Ca.ET.042.01.1.1]RUX19287.1 ABC transporter permease [Mesorhizobium sp. M2A.F.Ca.ET.042.01.1.1]
MRRLMLFLPAIALLAAFVILPAFGVMSMSLFDPDFSFKHFERFFTLGAYLTLLLNTLETSLIVALTTALVGYPISYFIYLQKGKVQRLLLFLILIPFWMSVLVRTFAWMVLLGREGLVNWLAQWSGLTSRPIQLLFTPEAVVLAMVQILLPVQIFICFSAMSEIDVDLLRAARILGAKPRQAVLRVFVPLSLEGALTGTIITFMLSMGFFITPALLGGPKDQLIGNLVTTQVEQVNWAFAAAVSFILLVTTLVAIGLLRTGGQFIIRRMVYGSAR